MQTTTLKLKHLPRLQSGSRSEREIMGNMFLRYMSYKAWAYENGYSDVIVTYAEFVDIQQFKALCDALSK